MILQPPSYKPAKGFPKKTFKGLAGLMIALGIAVVIIGVAEIIYSVNIANECSRWDYTGPMYMDDEVYPPGQEEARWRDKRQARGHEHHARAEEGPEWMDDVKAHDDFDSSSDDAENDPHLRWLTESVSDMDMAQRCEVFSCVAVVAALTYASCGVIFIVTGSLGVGAARTIVGHRQSGLKTGFIVMNILNVLGFAPAVFVLGCFIAKAAPVVIEKDDYYDGHVVTGQIIAFMGIVLTIISLVAASISCCCAPTEEHVKVITMSASPVQQMAPALIFPAQLQVDEKAQLVENEATEA